MRPVNKGISPGTYGHWDDARDDLKRVIGKYCSYCEMKLTHMPHIEHVVPRENGGSETDWENLLFSCVHCNSRKGTTNSTRDGYLWPDKHNTHLAFVYPDANMIQTSPLLTGTELQKGEALIKLCGLDKNPSHPKFSIKDERWTERDQTWQIALDSLQNWQEAPSEAMAQSIANAAIGHGHFSIWMRIFQKEPVVRKKIMEAFPGTEKECYDDQTQPVQHVGRV